MDVRSVVPISIGGVDLFVASDRVRAILGVVSVVAVPGGPRGLVGVTAWANRVVAVFELSALLGEFVGVVSRPRTVVVDAGTGMLAIPVDSVREPREVDRSRPAHASRMSFVDVEVEAGGLVGPMLDLASAIREFERIDA